MTKIILLSSIILFTINVSGQNQIKSPVDSLYEKDIMETKEIYPNLSIKECEQLSNLISTEKYTKVKEYTIKYPPQAAMNGTQGNVYARFLIDTLGALSGIKIIKGLGDGCSEAVIRMIKLAAKDKWEPTIIDGKKQVTYQKLFVIFSLE